MKSGLQTLIFTGSSHQVNPRRGKISPWHAFVGAVIAVFALLILPTGTATAASTVSGAHILAHFNLSLGQRPENITLEPNGTADLTFNGANQIVQETLDGQLHLLATMPVPAGGGTSTPIFGAPFLAGIVRADNGTLYFNYSTGTPDLTGIWRLRPGSVPERIAALSVKSLANGLALDEDTGMLYIADSALGTIWRVSIHGGTPIAWASAPALAPTGFLGANGIKVHNDAVWATNLDAGTILRIPIATGGVAGPITIKATGLHGIDDFAFIGCGDTLLAALNPSSQLALVQPDGTSTIVLTGADGLSNPTSVAVRDDTIYVPSAAYITNKDPNLLLAYL